MPLLYFNVGTRNLLVASDLQSEYFWDLFETFYAIPSKLPNEANRIMSSGMGCTVLEGEQHTKRSRNERVSVGE